MLKRIMFLLALIALIALTNCAYGSDIYERVSFFKLVNYPESFVGKEVQLNGYFTKESDNCLLVMHDKSTAVIYREYEMVLVCVPDSLTQGKEDVFNRMLDSYGSVSGVFQMFECGESLKVGADLSYLGCLENIKSLYGPVSDMKGAMPPPPEYL